MQARVPSPATPRQQQPLRDGLVHTAAAATAARPVVLRNHHHGQEDGLHRLRLLAPQLLAREPQPRLVPPQQEQQQALFELNFVVDSGWQEEDDLMLQDDDDDDVDYAGQQQQQHSSGAVQHHQHRHAGQQPLSSSRKKMHPKQLMAAIRAAASVGELQALTAQHRASLDPLATAAMLNRLAHTWSSTRRQAQRAHKQQQQQQQLGPQHVQQQQQQSPLGSGIGAMQTHQQHGSHTRTAAAAAGGRTSTGLAETAAGAEQAVLLLRQLLELFIGYVPRYSSRQLSSALWVVGRFHRAAAAYADVQHAAVTMLQALLGSSSSSSSSLSHHVQHQQQQLRPASSAGPVCLLQRDGNAADIQNVMWALGRLSQVMAVDTLLPGQQHPCSSSSSSRTELFALLDQLCAAVLSSARKADGQFVANCLYGFAHIGAPAPRLFEALATRANPSYCKQLQSQHVVVITWAAAKLGQYCPALYDRLLWRAVAVRVQLYPQGVGLLLAACAAVGHRPDSKAVAQLVQVCKAQWWKLRGKHLSNLVYGLMRTGCLQQHRAFFMGVLLCQVTAKLHELQPLGVATVLQALLQVSTPQHGTAHLHRAQEGAAGAAVPQQQQRRPRQQRAALQDSSSSSSGQSPVSRVSPAATAARAHELSAELGGGQGDGSRQLELLLQAMGAQIAAQLPQTSPQTLYNIIICLAGIGFYEPSLYDQLAAAAAAAAAAGRAAGSGGAAQPSLHRHARFAFSQQQQQQEDLCVYNSEQCVQLLHAFSSFQHAAPGLWQQLLPVLAADAASLTGRQLSQCLTAAAGSGLGPELQLLGRQQLHVLLQLAAVALQPQQLQLGLAAATSAEGQAMQGLVRLAAAGSTLVLAADRQQQQQQGGVCGRGVDAALLAVVHMQTDRLVGQLAAVVCTQPQLHPWTHLVQLLQAALLLLSTRSTRRHFTAAPTTTTTSMPVSSSSSMPVSSSSSSTSLPAWQPVVDASVVQQLTHLVQHPQLWTSGSPRPQDLVTLLQCATHPAMHNNSSSGRCSSGHPAGEELADAAAEQLLSCLGRCGVHTLVTLLQVLAAAWQQPGEVRYGHAGLVSATSRQLHRQLLLASRAQLAAAVAALELLQQQHTPLHRAACALMANQQD